MSQQLKVTALVILGLITLLFAYNYSARGNKIDTLNQTVGGQKATIGGLSKAIEVDKKADAITDNATARAASQQKDIEARFDKATQDTHKVETVIRQKYDKVRAHAQAQAPDGRIPPELEAALTRQQEDEVSAARLSILRAYLCDIDPVAQTNCEKGTSP